jgi:hypothetical protein
MGRNRPKRAKFYKYFASIFQKEGFLNSVIATIICPNFDTDVCPFFDTNLVRCLDIVAKTFSPT